MSILWSLAENYASYCEWWSLVCGLIAQALSGSSNYLWFSATLASTSGDASQIWTWFQLHITALVILCSCMLLWFNSLAWDLLRTAYHHKSWNKCNYMFIETLFPLSWFCFLDIIGKYAPDNPLARHEIINQVLLGCDTRCDINTIPDKRVALKPICRRAPNYLGQLLWWIWNLDKKLSTQTHQSVVSR